MARKIYVTVTTKLIITANDDVDVDEVLEEMSFDFTSTTEGADIVESEIDDWDITDSK